jgi:hypothetical protein
MILVTQPDNPLPRAAKGTVNRKAALFAYETEINAAYVVIPEIARGSRYRFQVHVCRPSREGRRLSSPGVE